MALSFGPDGITQLVPGQWRMDLSFRYLYAHEGWRGANRWPGYETEVGNQVTVRSVDLQFTHSLTNHLALTLTIPYSDAQHSVPSTYDGLRHVMRVRGVGDVRLVASAWLLDANPNRDGNLSIGFGVKLPTGKSAAIATYFKPTGPEVRHADVSVQPGDGGWGVMLEATGYRRLTGRIFAYANGYYVVNPRETNAAYTTSPLYGEYRPISVPDQFQARAGLSSPVWAERGLTISVGIRINGIPSRDLIGGSEGFRRSGYVTYFEPGLSWIRGANSFSIFMPTRLDANRTRNVYDKRANMDGAGAFARRLWFASYAFVF
jgi:hypothetical protein